MNHARRVAYWAVPSLLCLAVHWYGFNSWFQADDFAWLGLGLDVHDWRSFLDAMFSPRAQGTVRPWSERAYFMGFYSLFGLDALPFRIWVFLTQVANLVLVASIAARLTASRAAGFWAAVFWGVNASLAQVLAWSSAYNQALVTFFILLSFHFLLRSIETGRRRYEVAQWIVFLLGFGAQELNVVYPALAGGYTLLCARKHFRRTLPLFAVSIAYTAAHMLLIPRQTTGLYVMHFTSSVLRTLATYWSWTVGPPWLVVPWKISVAWVVAGVVLVSIPLLAFAVRRALRGDRLPSFFVLWYVAAIAPVLPLRDHLTEYYPFLPAIGLAMLGGFALVVAWRRNAAWKAAAVLTAAVYLVMAVPSARAAGEWFYNRSRRVERLVLGVERAHELHPGRTILLHGVDETLFWMGVLDRPYRLFGAQVFLTPDSEKMILANPAYGDVAEFVLPPEATARALDRDAVVVYDVSGERLKNITSTYSRSFANKGATPRRIDATSPLMDYLLGPTWYKGDPQTRWMPAKATFRIAGPASPSEKLYLRGICPEKLLAAGPVDVTVTADGIPLAPARITPANASFEFAFTLPARLVGKDAIEIGIAVSRTFVPPEDGRELGLAFGTFEVR
ncbi:MAG TPA: hypothetical protein VN442_23805 [Bryobacteraceae bacterium]|nr:hypothetical protein [Bryobacteraceae bacterium]